LTAAEGCDAIIHTAANTNIWPNRSEIVRRVNIEGTKNILAAAKRAQVKRLVYIGTANSFGFGVANALTMGTVGESYIAGNENMDYREAFTKIAKVVGVQPPKITIPPTLSKAYGFLGTQYGTLFNKTPVVSLAMAQISCDDHYFTSKKAVEELNMPLTNIEVGIRECFEWLKDNGYC